jgi:phosphoenolpyruvate carboxykinase (GTP)
MGSRIAHPPHIFSVNWFRKDEAGSFIWPGFGHNMRVLKWIFERCEGTAKGRETALGIVPTFDDLDWAGIEFAPERFAQAIGVDVEAWKRELAAHDELFARVGEKKPAALAVERAKLGSRLAR